MKIENVNPSIRVRNRSQWQCLVSASDKASQLAQHVTTNTFLSYWRKKKNKKVGRPRKKSDWGADLHKTWPASWSSAKSPMRGSFAGKRKKRNVLKNFVLKPPHTSSEPEPSIRMTSWMTGKKSLSRMQALRNLRIWKARLRNQTRKM